MDWAAHIGRIVTKLGEDVTIVRGTGTPVTVRGVFTRPYATMELGIGSVTGSNPTFSYMTADYSAAVNDVLTRSAVTYKVSVKQDDDPSGVTMLELKKSP